MIICKVELKKTQGTGYMYMTQNTKKYDEMENGKGRALKSRVVGKLIVASCENYHFCA